MRRSSGPSQLEHKERSDDGGSVHGPLPHLPPTSKQKGWSSGTPNEGGGVSTKVCQRMLSNQTVTTFTMYLVTPKTVLVQLTSWYEAPGLKCTKVKVQKVVQQDKYGSAGWRTDSKGKKK